MPWPKQNGLLRKLRGVHEGSIQICLKTNRTQLVRVAYGVPESDLMLNHHNTYALLGLEDLADAVRMRKIG